MSLLVQKQKKVSVGHRGRFDIIANILGAAMRGAKKTQLMYRCNLSFRQLEVYLGLLTAKKLINGRLCIESKKVIVYKTTEKGQSFLQVYHSLQALLTP